MDVYDFLQGFSTEATKRAYQSDIAQYEHITNGMLSREAVIKFRDMLLAKGLSPSSVARKMSSVRSYCDFLRGQGLLSTDPFAGVKAPKVSVANPTQAFTDDEVRKIFKAAEKDPNKRRDLVVLGLLFFAGLRRSEIVKLRFNDLTVIDGEIIIRIFGKGGKYRMIPAHPKLKAFLAPFTDKNTSNLLLDVSAGTIYAIVKKYAKMIGVTRNVSPHSCRATAISQLLENGESPRNVADFAGHSSVNTTIGSYDKKRDGIKNSSAMKLNF